MGGVPLALCGTRPACCLAGRKHGAENLLVRPGPSRRNRTRREARIRAVEIEADALRELWNHVFAEAGIGADDASLSARVALFYAADHGIVRAALRLRMRADHLLDVHGHLLGGKGRRERRRGASVGIK